MHLVLGSVNILGGKVPGWVQIVLWVSALVTSLGVLWVKVFRPAIRAAAAAEKMLPLLRELTTVFADNPTAFKVLDEIAAQFRTDSGSSLRDVVNELTKSVAAAARQAELTAANTVTTAQQLAKDLAAAGQLASVQIEVVRQLATQDREQMNRLPVLIDRLESKVNVGLAAIVRIERTAGGMFADMVAGHQAADEAIIAGGAAGAAADAFSSSHTDEEEKLIKEARRAEAERSRRQQRP